MSDPAKHACTSPSCRDCGATAPTALFTGPDPFLEEVKGDPTPVTLCGPCRRESFLRI